MTNIDDTSATIESIPGALRRIRRIRTEVEATIANGSNIATRRRKIDALSKHSHPDWVEEVTETSILIYVCDRVRPARTRRLLSRLRRLRAQKGETELYEKFSARVRDMIAPHILTQHGYNLPLHLRDLDVLFSGIDGYFQVLEALGYEAFINSGTLLGMVRDGHLIEHDDDVDLAVILHANSIEEAAIEWTELKKSLDKKGILDESSQRNIYKLTSLDDVVIDLFPCWFQGDHAYVYPHTFGELTREDILPLRLHSVEGTNMPADPKKMLAINYGPNWVKPDPLYAFPMLAAKRKFHEFLTATEKLQS